MFLQVHHRWLFSFRAFIEQLDEDCWQQREQLQYFTPAYSKKAGDEVSSRMLVKASYLQNVLTRFQMLDL